jgi:hypothetical protein
LGAYAAYAVFVTAIFIITMIPEIRLIRDLRRRGLGSMQTIRHRLELA